MSFSLHVLWVSKGKQQVSKRKQSLRECTSPACPTEFNTRYLIPGNSLFLGSNFFERLHHAINARELLVSGRLGLGRRETGGYVKDRRKLLVSPTLCVVQRIKGGDQAAGLTQCSTAAGLHSGHKKSKIETLLCKNFKNIFGFELFNGNRFRKPA